MWHMQLYTYIYSSCSLHTSKNLQHCYISVPTATYSSTTILETNYAITSAHSSQQTRQFHETVYHTEQYLKETQSLISPKSTQTGRVANTLGQCMCTYNDNTCVYKERLLW